MLANVELADDFLFLSKQYSNLVEALLEIVKIPAVTIHGSADFSAQHFERDRMEAGQRLIDVASPFLGTAKVTKYQVHGWRYSKPTVVDDAPCMLASEATDLPPLALAGDAFAGPRFEGAVQSGWAAANMLMGTH